MPTSDWINLGVAIGTILLALIATTTTILSLVERRRITKRRNDEILINEMIDWINKLHQMLESTDDKQSILDFSIKLMPFVSPTKDIEFIGKHFAHRYPRLGIELNDEIEKLLSLNGILQEISLAFAKAVTLEIESNITININAVFKEKHEALGKAFNAIHTILLISHKIKSQHLFTI